MKRFFPLIILLSVVCFVSGCVAGSSTCMKILEDREFSVYPRIDEPMEAYLLGDTLYVKYPTSIYTDRWTWINVSLLYHTWGGRTGLNWYADSDETVWIKKGRTNPEEDLKTNNAFLYNFEYDPADQHPEGKQKIARKIPLDNVKPAHDFEITFKLCFGFYPSPCIRSYSKNGFWWTTLAVLDGILIDFPVSLVMTATGSFWYIPLTEFTAVRGKISR